jgi:hypothetical protein
MSWDMRYPRVQRTTLPLQLPKGIAVRVAYETRDGPRGKTRVAWDRFDGFSRSWLSRERRRIDPMPGMG